MGQQKYIFTKKTLVAESTQREDVLYNPYAGSYGGVCENPCMLGADGEDVAFGVKQSISLAAARTINPCNHTT